MYVNQAAWLAALASGALAGLHAGAAPIRHVVVLCPSCAICSIHGVLKFSRSCRFRRGVVANRLRKRHGFLARRFHRRYLRGAGGKARRRRRRSCRYPGALGARHLDARSLPPMRCSKINPTTCFTERSASKKPSAWCSSEKRWVTVTPQGSSDRKDAEREDRR